MVARNCSIRLIELVLAVPFLWFLGCIELIILSYLFRLVGVTFDPLQLMPNNPNKGLDLPLIVGGLTIAIPLLISIWNDRKYH